MSRIDVKPAECWVTWQTVGYGLTAFFVFSPVHPCPIATVYGLFSDRAQGGKRRMEILDSHVVPWARRQGIRTLVNEAIFKHWRVDVIVSQAGTKDGEPFMRAAGYAIEPNTGVWYLPRPEAKKK